MTAEAQSMRLECAHSVEGKRFYNGVLCCGECWGRASREDDRTRPGRIAQAAEHQANRRREAAAVARTWLYVREMRFPGPTVEQRTIVEELIADLENAS